MATRCSTDTPALFTELRADMFGPAGFKPATWRLSIDVVRQAFATTLFLQTSTCLTMLTQSRVSPETKRASVSNTASEKPPTLRMSARPCACVVQ